MIVNNANSFSTYPTNRVCGIFDNSMDARSALDALLEQGIVEKNIDIFHGAEGSDILDAGGERHGLAAKIATQLRAYGDMENGILRSYEEAMLHGSYLFEVKAETDEIKESVEQILSRHGAHSINYFGPWYVEAMHEA
ncbi:MAG: hypothetical protein Q8916_05560 [Bacteroidota bacterium]|nr:hypothetical protein [Bacteroidota bacterium]MDP4229857.1 hypothetical protein [Bacteroidota bacterium]MDP4234968.1 hypothetical protein [Bacteroidota bacterium]